ncbi:MAG: hypothetical protein II729_09170, partial [Ruminococcus sp.]|nr:hypothetical protein [Ruminococcus sp.]
EPYFRFALLSVKPRGAMRTVRKNSLRCFYYFLGRALPFLVHLPARERTSLWTLIMSAFGV